MTSTGIQHAAARSRHSTSCMIHSLPVGTVHPELCEHPLGWQLVHAALPHAQQFFDVSANLGCITARFHELWSPASNFTLCKLHELVSKDGFQFPEGQCRHGAHEHLPLGCRGTGCSIFDAWCDSNSRCSCLWNISVIAFDGAKKFAQNVSRLIHQGRPELQQHLVYTSTWRC